MTTIIPCEAVRSRLVALVDGEMEPGEIEVIARHLQGCAECETARRQYAVLLSPNALKPVETADITDRVLAKIGWETARDFLAGVSPMEIAQARARADNLPFIDLVRHRPERAALDIVPAIIARRLVALPVKKDGRILFVAMLEPRNIVALDELRMASRCIVRPLAVESGQLRAAINEAYGPDLSGGPAPEPPAALSAETRLLLDEIHALRTEMTAMRAEMTELRTKIEKVGIGPQSEEERHPVSERRSTAGQRLLPFASPDETPIYLS